MAALQQGDISFIQSSGRDVQEISRQLEVLTGPRTFVRLSRPAALRDGICHLKDYDVSVLQRLYENALANNRVSSFIPASGSGTRLFQSLLALYREGATDLAHIRWRANRGDDTAKDALVVLENIEHFAIWSELSRRECPPNSLEHIFRALFADTFADTGLRAHELPKGLIPFHRYDSESRTAFSEHLREACALTAGPERKCRVHFTISASHRTLFERAWQRERPFLEDALNVQCHVEFSTQSPLTDTIGIDADGHILRDRSGQIAFRPGGHGALLPNLEHTGYDIVLIKNIDNIARDNLRPDIVRVRQLICGLLLLVENQVHTALRDLRQGANPQTAIQLLDTLFGITPVESLNSTELRRYADAQLNRPLRVCGVVGTLEHTGGRPFWIETENRGATLQLVESVEVNLDDSTTRRIFKHSKHFNPVELACSIRDVDGASFRLSEFSMPARAIITRKVVGGVPSLVYEHPGLWNGSMALWNTLFVEIPDLVFNPVKSLADLSAPGHRFDG